MSAAVLKFRRSGTPAELFENALEEAEDMAWVVMVICGKDQKLRFEWTALPSNLQAIGAVEFLKRELME